MTFNPEPSAGARTLIGSLRHLDLIFQFLFFDQDVAALTEKNTFVFLCADYFRIMRALWTRHGASQTHTRLLTLAGYKSLSARITLPLRKVSRVPREDVRSCESKRR